MSFPTYRPDDVAFGVGDGTAYDLFFVEPVPGQDGQGLVDVTNTNTNETVAGIPAELILALAVMINAHQEDGHG